jgi:hypothetical protein
MKRAPRFAGMAALIVLVASCSLFDYSSIVTKKYALVYGVTNYTATVLGGKSPNLSYPAADAKSVADMLTNAGYAIVHARWVDEASQVWVQDLATHTTLTSLGSVGSPYTDATTTSTTSVIDAGPASSEAPTKANIEADIQSLKGIVGKNDTVVVYFSGHGTPGSSHEYFDPYQGVIYWTAASDYYANPATCIQDDELGTYFAALSTARKVLILDTCNSGGFIGNSLEVDATPQTVIDSSTGIAYTVTVGALDILTRAIANYASFTSSSTGLSPYNAQVLSAAGRDESSYESASFGGGHGVMTYFLLQAGSKADLNNDKKVTVLEAFAYVKAEIDANWNGSASVIAAGETFEPHVSGGPVDFVLF